MTGQMTGQMTTHTQFEYGRRVRDELRAAGFFADLDDSDNTLPKKIRWVEFSLSLSLPRSISLPLSPSLSPPPPNRSFSPSL
jgi:hypothetical protein